MVRETRHLWVGNLPENVSKERIKEYFNRYFRYLRFTSTNHAIMESDIEENRRRQMEEIEALSSIYEENFILGNMI